MIICRIGEYSCYTDIFLLALPVLACARGFANFFASIAFSQESLVVSFFAIDSKFNLHKPCESNISTSSIVCDKFITTAAEHGEWNHATNDHPAE